MFWHNRHKRNKRDISKMHKQQADNENTKDIRNKPETHSLPGATTHVGSWPTQETASNHLSLALALKFLTPNFSASFVTPSIHLRFGLPARLLPSGLSKVIFLHGRLSCIHITCPAHLSLVILIVVTRSASSYKRYSSSLYLDLHTASSHMGPLIPLNIFVSKLQDITHPLCSGPRFPPHTSELVLFMFCTYE